MSLPNSGLKNNSPLAVNNISAMERFIEDSILSKSTLPLILDINLGCLTEFV